MAVLQMRKINICAMKKNRKKILELLQRRGCIEIHESMETDGVFEKTNTATQISIFERNSALGENALKVLSEYAPEKKGMLSALEGKRDIDDREYVDVIEGQQETMSLVNDILRQKKDIEERTAEISTANEKGREKAAGGKSWMIPACFFAPFINFLTICIEKLVGLWYS